MSSMWKIDRGMAKSLFFACIFCLLASPTLANESAQANMLMIEAVKLIQASEREPSAEGKFRLLERAHGNLLAIIERYPSTDLAVTLATGQRVGNISLHTVRQAMDQARVAEPGEPGAPARVWRHGAGVVAASLSSRGRRALTVSKDGVAELHDIETGELVRTWQHRARMTAAAFSPRGQRMLMAGGDGTVALREAGTGRILSEWQHDRAVGAVALSRDGGQALVAAGYATLLIDVATLDIRRTWQHGSPVRSVAYAPDGRWIFAGFADGRAVLGETGTGRTLHAWEHPGSGGGGVTSAAFSPDGRRVLAGAANTMAVLRDVATGRILHEWRLGDPATSVAFSRDGRWVLTGDEGYEVELHDTETGRTVHKWRYDDEPHALAFSPDGSQALMGFADGMAILCDIRRSSYARTHLTRDGGCW